MPLIVRFATYTGVLCCMVQGLIAQSISTAFTALIWAEEFETPNNSLWRQATNADELYLVQNGRYILQRKNTKTAGLIFPGEKALFNAHKAEFAIQLDESNSKSASGGVIIMGQEDGKGAFLIELNGKREYRISKYNGNSFTPIADGWKKNKKINGRGEDNLVAVSMEDKRYDLYINSAYITSFSEVAYKNGRIGLYIAPDSKMSVDFVHIYITPEEKERLRKELEKKKEAEEDPTLTGIIKKLREQMVLLEIERDSLRVVVEDLKKKNGDGGSSPSLQKLRTENRDLKIEIERLKKENTALGKENDALKRFKETIRNNENGDIIISLTEAIETERQRLEILADENEKLYEEIRKLQEQLKN